MTRAMTIKSPTTTSDKRGILGKVNDLTLKEYIARLDKIKRSVKRHSAYGVRGYYDFIKNFI